MKSRTSILPFLVLAFLWIIPDAGICQSKKEAEITGVIQDLSASLADLASRVRPAVVQIRTIGFDTVKPGATGFVTSQRATGSGVILDGDGFIVTNAHVVKGARYIEVWLNDAMQQNSNSTALSQKRSAAARLVGMDQDTDLAVLKIDRTGLPTLSLVDSDSLRQGQIVMAFGNPMALENSASMGVISSADRQLSSGDPAVYIQTDAPINPGNSGGALVDVQGRLAGINTFILSQSGGSEGIGFAIPANVVQRVYTELRKEGHIHHGHIGIRVLGVTPSLAAGLQLPRDWGVIVEDVEPKGPSDRAGLHPGDYLLSVDGKDLKDLHQMLMVIDRHAIGDTMMIRALRGPDKIEAVVTVEERDDDPNRFYEMVTESANLVPGLGILAIDLNENLLKLVPEMRKPAGVLVAALTAGSTGSEEVLEPGDMIISFNGKPAVNVETLRKFLSELKTGSPIVLQIQHEDQLKFIVLEMP
ncbi:MAG TPA: trypsin-like peptidase domain-containing protein [Acidobacteriota bacterium]|nr:trypsin-like peptidase domain-containing protein [Acidobacteriota bacterium]